MTTIDEKTDIKSIGPVSCVMINKQLTDEDLIELRKLPITIFADVVPQNRRIKLDFPKLNAIYASDLRKFDLTGCPELTYAEDEIGDMSYVPTCSHGQMTPQIAINIVSNPNRLTFKCSKVHSV